MGIAKCDMKKLTSIQDVATFVDIAIFEPFSDKLIIAEYQILVLHFFTF